MEIAREPHSILTKTFQDKAGRTEAACRSSLWCGHDLSTREGLRLVLEQINTLRPKRVWVSPPCGPYSPLQNINQRTPSQIQDLKAKRLVANRIYDSTLEIVKTCLQLGIHVAVELAEKCEAWRLPIFQKLRFEMGLHTGVRKGCTVGLKGHDGQLLQKGWRIVTSHKLLAEKMHKPCRCPTNYKHAKCEGSNTAKTTMYTKEFARLVWEAFHKEGSCSQIVEECTGRSELPESFRLGLMRTCHQSDLPCGACCITDACPDTGSSHEAYACQETVPQLEQQSQQELQRRSPKSLKALESLLGRHELPRIGKSRRPPESWRVPSFRFLCVWQPVPCDQSDQGSASILQLCECYPEKIFPKDMCWTSFVVNHGVHTPIHRDSNNDAMYPNGSVGSVLFRRAVFGLRVPSLCVVDKG